VSRLRRAGSLAAKIGVSAAAFWLISRQVRGHELVRAFAGVRLWLLAAGAFMYLAGQLVTSHRWRLIANALGFPHGELEIARIYFIGMFFNLFGPATVGGDVVRGLYLAERDGRRVVALNSVLFDRLAGLVMLIFVAAVTLAGFGRFGLPPALVVVTLAAGIGLTAGWWLVPGLARRLLAPRNRIRRVVDNDLGPLWRDRSLLAKTAVVSLVFHIWQILALMVIGYAAGVHVPWAYYFICHPLVTVLGAMPVSLAGIGIRELGYVWFLQQQGVPHELGLTLALLWFAVLLVASLAGATVFVLSGASLPKVRVRRAA